MIDYASANGSAERIAGMVVFQLGWVLDNSETALSEVRIRPRSVARRGGFTITDVNTFASRVIDGAELEGDLASRFKFTASRDDNGPYFTPTTTGGQ